MKGIHSIYTFTNKKNQSYLNMGLFEAYTLILSCIYWKKLYGNIKLYCDFEFYQFINKNGFKNLWDEIDYKAFNNLPKEIDYSIFWTYPKMYIHSLQKEPFTSIDADLYISKKIKIDADVAYAHSEAHSNKYYPSYHKEKRYLNIFKNIKIEENLPIMNTCVLTINKLDFYQELIKVTTNFAKQVSKEKYKLDPIAYTIFCEQKIISSILKKYKITTKPYYKKEWNPDGLNNKEFKLEDSGIFHLWWYKNIIRENYNLRLNTNLKLEKIIEKEHPEMMDIANKFKKLLKF